MWFTCNHYDVVNSEPRIATYLAIASGAPQSAYFHLNRTFPPTCDFAWTETQAVGVTRSYLGVDVFEGAYQYRAMRVVPSWGGSMFEALMPALFVPETRWGPRSWASTIRSTCARRSSTGCTRPVTATRASRRPTIPRAATAPTASTRSGCRPTATRPTTTTRSSTTATAPAGRPVPDPPQSAYTNGVVTPHASFVALDYAPRAALDNLARLRSHFAAYGSGGFFDAVNVDSGTVARFYLALDQGMAMAGAVNALTGDRLQKLFAPARAARAPSAGDGAVRRGLSRLRPRS